jgi:hypothetical protein
MLEHESLYEIIRVKNFATTQEVEERWQEFSNRQNLDPSSTMSEKVDTAFRFLRHFETKQIYDTLLDALQRRDKTLPRFASPGDETATLELAVYLNLPLVPIGPLTYKIATPGRNRGENGSVFARYTLPVGEAFLSFIAIPFVAESDRFSEEPVLCLDGNQDVALQLRSIMTTVKIRHGDQGLLIRVGCPNETPRLNAGYVNITSSVFGPLETASNHYFPENSLEIAQRFGLRNSKPRIQQIILEYYAALAEALARFDARIDRDTAKNSFTRVAKEYHKQFR